MSATTVGLRYRLEIRNAEMPNNRCCPRTEENATLWAEIKARYDGTMVTRQLTIPTAVFAGCGMRQAIGEGLVSVVMDDDNLCAVPEPWLEPLPAEAIT